MTDLTEGLRIYAIGDMHGRLDLLTEMLARIRADLARRPHPAAAARSSSATISTAGRESRGVLEVLIALKASDLPARFLLGNHDSYVSAYLRDPDWYDRTYHWLADNMGGNATLASYGVPDASARRPAATRDAFAAAFPPEHLAFLDACELCYPPRRLRLRPRRHPARRAARGPGPRRPDLDPRAVPDLAPPTSASRWCTATPSCRRSSTTRTGSPSTPGRSAPVFSPACCSRPTSVALLEPAGPRPCPPRLRPAELAHALAPALRPNPRLSACSGRASGISRAAHAGTLGV